MCVCVCVYVCMCVYVCVSMHIYMNVHVSVNVIVRICDVGLGMSTCICLCLLWLTVVLRCVYLSGSVDNVYSIWNLKQYGRHVNVFTCDEGFSGGVSWRWKLFCWSKRVWFYQLPYFNVIPISQQLHGFTYSIYACVILALLVDYDECCCDRKRLF